MQRVDDPRGFRGHPYGHYLIGRYSLVWCHSPKLAGTVIWGRPGIEDARTLTSFWQNDSWMEDGYDTVDDFSRLERVDHAAFEALANYVREMLPRYEKRIRRQALVRGDGLAAVVVEGFYPALGAKHTYSVFTTLVDAFGWLERPEATAVLPVVQEIIAREIAADPEMRVMRIWLEDHLLEPTLELAAAALSTSARTLQRRLADAGTSFREEVQRARIAAARYRLATGDEKVETIAGQVGLSSASHLARTFRAATGETPAQFRARHR